MLTTQDMGCPHWNCFAMASAVVILVELVSFTETDDWVFTFIVDFCFHGSKIMASHDFTGVEVVVEGAGSK